MRVSSTLWLLSSLKSPRQPSELFRYCSEPARQLSGRVNALLGTDLLMFSPLPAMSVVLQPTFTLVSSIWTPLVPQWSLVSLFSHIHFLLPWISCMILLAMKSLHCPGKHIHNYQSLHSDACSGKLSLYLCNMSPLQISPHYFLLDTCAWAPCNDKNSSPRRLTDSSGGEVLLKSS